MKHSAPIYLFFATVLCISLFASCNTGKKRANEDFSHIIIQEDSLRNDALYGYDSVEHLVELCSYYTPRAGIWTA